MRVEYFEETDTLQITFSDQDRHGFPQTWTKTRFSRRTRRAGW